MIDECRIGNDLEGMILGLIGTSPGNLPRGPE
jgi:hypothetical protein